MIHYLITLGLGLVLGFFSGWQVRKIYTREAIRVSRSIRRDALGEDRHRN